ncbi:MAG: hypothetical protein AAGJ38_05060 [Planctomycetota bacterium]
MSVTQIQLIDEYSEQSEGVLTGTRVYQVFVDSLNDDSETARNASVGSVSIPSEGDDWKSGSAMTARKIAAKRAKKDSQETFIVTVSYSSGSGTTAQETNPLDRPADIEWSGLSERETYFEDTEGNKAVNTAGDPFDRLPDRDVAKGVTVTVTRNLATNLSASLKALHKVRSSSSVAIDGIVLGANTARVENWKVSGVLTENGVNYRRHTVTISGKPNWDDEFESRGRRQVDGTDILDLHGERVAEPWPLDASGNPLESPGDTPATVTLIPYEEASFASISSIWS